MARDTLEEELRKRGAPSSVTEQLPREKLSKDLQDLVNNTQDNFWDGLYDGAYARAHTHAR